MTITLPVSTHAIIKSVNNVQLNKSDYKITHLETEVSHPPGVCKTTIRSVPQERERERE